MTGGQKMTTKPSLVIMAAGLGSRYGGLKQIDPVDQEGHLIIDLSIYDAVLAGFERVICIIKPEMEEEFREAIGDRISKFVDLEYAHQKMDRLPAGFSVPDGRTKPWGTAHAILCAADKIRGSFAAINADDYYGRSAFQTIYDFLATPMAENRHAMVGYRVENTLTEFGHVARGICSVSDQGELSGIVERTHVESREGGAAFTENGVDFTFVPAGTIVSMNMWGFRHSILAEIETRFEAYLRANLPINPLKCEYFLPLIPNQLIQEGVASVNVLTTQEKWYGVTYRHDMRRVRAAIIEMKQNGMYADHLWCK
jgi:NDP-sugar pyrophosphorylase family protein